MVVRRKAQVALTAICFGLTLLVAACSSSDTDSTSDSDEGESFLAYGASLSSSEELSFGSADIVTFRLENGPLVPSTRLANGANAGVISVFQSLSSADLEYEGFPLLNDGSFAVWQQSGDVNSIERVSPASGERQKIFKTKNIESVSFYIEQQLFVVNADYCYIVRTDGVTRRVGRGQCEGSKAGLRFITTSSSSLNIFSVDEELELGDRRSFPLRNGDLSSGGGLVFGESASTSRLAVFDVMSGQRLWFEADDDIEATVLSVSAEGDAIIVGHDRDDGDSQIDLIGIASAGDGPTVTPMGSARSVGVQLSTSGKQALIATRAKSSDAYSFKTVSLSGDEVQIPYKGSPEGFAIGKSDIYTYVSDETLYVGRFGETPRRAFDLFGEVTRLAELRDTKTLIVVTEFEGESTVTAITVDDEVSATVLAEGAGLVQFSPRTGGRNDRVLFTLKEDDGYGTLFEAQPSTDNRARRLAEGNIAAFSYGPGGDVYYVDAFGGNYSSYRVPANDQGKRLLVSSRYVVLRQGSQQLRETSGGLQGFMDAYVDPAQQICATEGLKTITFGESETPIEIPEISGGSVSLCVKVPKESRGQTLEISHVTNGDVNADTALEVFTSTAEMRDDVVSVEGLKLVATNDDSFIDNAIVLPARIQSVVFERPYYIIRSSSWANTVKATVKLVNPTGAVVSEVFGFSTAVWESRASAFAGCKEKPFIKWLGNSAGKPLKQRVGVDSAGNSDIYEFCISVLKPSEDSASRFDLTVSVALAGSPSAEFVLGCSNLKGVRNLLGEGRYRASDETEELRFSTPDFSTSLDYSMSYQLTKGLFGPCYVTHDSPNPRESGRGTAGSLTIALAPVDES